MYSKAGIHMCSESSASAFQTIVYSVFPDHFSVLISVHPDMMMLESEGVAQVNENNVSIPLVFL
jgi:hypothetical protein